jgi:hypothetical protein
MRPVDPKLIEAIESVGQPNWTALVTAIVAILGIAVTACGLYFLVLQISIASKTTRAALQNDLVGVIHFDGSLQRVLQTIYRNKLTLVPDQSGLRVTFNADPSAQGLDDQVNALLSRLQMIGHLFNIGVLHRSDLRGIRFEIIMTGRNQAVREYLRYLNTKYQDLSGVVHDHFRFFKNLYIAFEYDLRHLKSFEDCLFKLPAHIRE